ncbi:ABC transporter permease subunit [Microvirga sp. W0021]|uniref:Glutathione transport system permease protein GsiD n=1 Tax=Hohaiivirga grylli TaxID=3133970 RepID=A0ABV0BP98_9HYPH
MSTLSQVEVSGRRAEKVRSPLREFWRRFCKQKIALAAGLFLVVLVLVAIFADFIAPYGLDTPDYDAITMPPSWAHWAGTDDYGRDIFSRIIFGARISLAVGFLSVTIGGLVGIALGLISGFYGGWIDNLIMRICDVLLAFPGIVLAIAVISILGPGVDNVIYAVAVFSIPVFARLVRGSTLAIKQSVYVDAARAIGVSNNLLMLRHILPGTLPSVIVYFSMRIGTAILTAASLSFIGLGAQPPSPEWGAMLAAGRTYIETEPHLALYPGLAIFVTVLAFNLLGDGLRDALDPKLKQD